LSIQFALANRSTPQQARKVDRGKPMRLVKQLLRKDVGRQQLSSYLLLVLQAFCRLPSGCLYLLGPLALPH
jgi:hypothetical protein